MTLVEEPDVNCQSCGTECLEDGVVDFRDFVLVEGCRVEVGIK